MSNGYRILKMCAKDFSISQVYMRNIRWIEILRFKKKKKNDATKKWMVSIVIYIFQLWSRNDTYSIFTELYFFFMSVNIYIYSV